jgi:hypothetical protein
MNIIKAARLMKPGLKLVSEDGFVAVLDEEGMLVNETPEGTSCVAVCREAFGFFLNELLSDKWRVVDE